MAALRRIPFGLNRLPRAISADDARLPAAFVGATVLRLNSEPLPPAAMPDSVGDHGACVVAMRDWLETCCGDYAPLRVRFIVTYLTFLSTLIAANQTALAEGLARYDGLYAPEDWFWSAPRPLPRAWLPGQQDMLPADIAFWDGAQPLAMELSARETPRETALREAGVPVLRISPDALAEPAMLGALLPEPFHNFWRGENLPASPFRRPVPRGVLSPPTA